MRGQLLMICFAALYEDITSFLELDSKMDDNLNEALYDLESNKDFQLKFLLHHDESEHIGIFTDGQREKLVNHISGHLEKELSIKTKEITQKHIRDYLEFIIEITDYDDVIDLEGIMIQEYKIYIAIKEEMLEIKDRLNELINAEDFKQAFNDLKKKTLEYLFDLKVDEARSELRHYSFED